MCTLTTGSAFFISPRIFTFHIYPSLPSLSASARAAPLCQSATIPTFRSHCSHLLSFPLRGISRSLPLVSASQDTLWTSLSLWDSVQGVTLHSPVKQDVGTLTTPAKLPVNTSGGGCRCFRLFHQGTHLHHDVSTKNLCITKYC